MDDELATENVKPHSELLAAASVVGAVVIVQTVAEVDASKKSGFFVSSSEQKKGMSTAALLLDPSNRNRPFRMANSMVDMEWPVPIAGDRVIDTIDRCV
eukprot:scaffold791_cov78-Skeletonema_dohrnii-CCMP3373.AAC.1